MPLSKREYCRLFAKEDIRRQQAEEQSIAAQVVARNEFDAFSKVLSAKASRGDLDTYVRTKEGWQRRASSLRIAELATIAVLVLRGQDINVDDIRPKTTHEITLENGTETNYTTASRAEGSEVATRTTRGEAPSRVAVSDAPSRAGRSETPSRAGKSEAPSCVAESQAPRRAGRSKAPSRAAGSEAGSEAPSRAAGSEAPSRAAGSEAPSRAVRSSKRVLNKAATMPPETPRGCDGESTSMESDLSSVNFCRAHTGNEEEARVRFASSVKELKQLDKEGELRTEQFRRKLAELKVGYWTTMDRIRNHASPTVINT